MLAIGAGLIGGFYNPRRADIAQSPLTAPAAAAKPPSPASALPQGTPATVWRTARAPVPAGVLEVLPDLTAPIKDWRSFQPHEITVTPRPAMPVSFVEVSIEQTAERTTWIGRSEIDHATLAAIATKDSWTAVLAFRHGNEYTITVAGGHAIVMENNPDLDVCGNGLESDVQRAVSGPVAGAGLAAATSSDETTGYAVDVVLLYDDATEKASEVASAGLGLTAGAYIDSVMRARLESGNLALDQSGVNNFHWRCVGLFKIPAYENAGNKMEVDLDMITNASGIAGQFAQDRAVATGADQTVLIVGGNRDYSGLAWSPGNQAIILWAASYLTLAHELGHNFSCQHDRQTKGAADGDGLFCYGHRFIDQHGRDTGTIMSYAGFRLPYFSNPAVIIDGIALGVPADQPRAADNARTLREHAAEMASFRDQIAALAIIQQPRSVTVNVGDPLAFSVTATGDRLSYQWLLGETAIPGATATTFSKSAAAIEDSGSYSVAISDAKGSVRSDTVTATIIAGNSGNPGISSASSVASGSDAGTGGGGGGGAPSLWFLGALATLVAVRRLLDRN